MAAVGSSSATQVEEKKSPEDKLVAHLKIFESSIIPAVSLYTTAATSFGILSMNEVAAILRRNGWAFYKFPGELTVSQSQFINRVCVRTGIDGTRMWPRLFVLHKETGRMHPDLVPALPGDELYFPLDMNKKLMDRAAAIGINVDEMPNLPETDNPNASRRLGETLGVSPEDLIVFKFGVEVNLAGAITVVPDAKYPDLRPSMSKFFTNELHRLELYRRTQEAALRKATAALREREAAARAREAALAAREKVIDDREANELTNDRETGEVEDPVPPPIEVKPAPRGMKRTVFDNRGGSSAKKRK